MSRWRVVRGDRSAGSSFVRQAQSPGVAKRVVARNWRQGLALEVGFGGKLARSKTGDVEHVDRTKPAPGGVPMPCPGLPDGELDEFPIEVISERNLEKLAVVQRGRQAAEECADTRAQFGIRAFGVGDPAELRQHGIQREPACRMNAIPVGDFGVELAIVPGIRNDADGEQPGLDGKVGEFGIQENNHASTMAQQAVPFRSVPRTRI